MTRTSVRVFLYGDYACPFSYVTDARVDRLREEVEAQVFWRPLPVHGTVPPEGLRRAELGMPPAEAGELRRAVEAMARDLDLPLQWPERVVNSYGALQVSEFAKDLGVDVFEQVHKRLFRAYFVEGRNLGRREQLVEVAAGAGLDPEAVEGCLADARYEDEIRRAEEEAQRYGIESTPTLLIERFKLVGAAPLEVMREVAARAAAEREGRDTPDHTADADAPAQGSTARRGEADDREG